MYSTTTKLWIPAGSKRTEPFSKISVYRKFLDPRYEESYKGLNDRDLLLEMKNDSFINETEVSYIPVSDLYREASLKYIRAHPVAYAKNVIQSAILYFSPATTYSLSVQQSVEIKIYDVVYSFNLTHFARSKESRRIMLTISALPKMILYFLVFLNLFRSCIKNKSIEPWNLFMVFTIGFVFVVSIFFEHYENMRFRFETEPLFIILAAQILPFLYDRFRERRVRPSGS